ncbi:MAG: glycosyltransferase [Ignavibacteriaceae bacterium]
MEQINSIQKFGIEFYIYPIQGKGISGYLKNLKPINKKIKEFKPDLIHAHYGLSGLLACLLILPPYSRQKEKQLYLVKW